MSRQTRRAAARAHAKADRRTYKPGGETRQGFVDRVHGEVTAGETIHDLWETYRRNRFALRIAEAGGQDLEPEHWALLRECFYAGVASMFFLMDKMSGPNSEDDDIGAARLTRLYEELETYQKGLK